MYDLEGRRWIKPVTEPADRLYSLKARYAPRLVNQAETGVFTDAFTDPFTSQMPGTCLISPEIVELSDTDHTDHTDEIAGQAGDESDPKDSAESTCNADDSAQPAPSPLASWALALVAEETLAWRDEGSQQQDSPATVESTSLEPSPEPYKTMTAAATAALQAASDRLEVAGQRIETLQGHLPKQLDNAFEGLREYVSALSENATNHECVSARELDQRFDSVVRTILGLINDGFSDLKEAFAKNNSTLHGCVEKIHEANQLRGKNILATESVWRNIKQHFDDLSEEQRRGGSPVPGSPAFDVKSERDLSDVDVAPEHEGGHSRSPTPIRSPELTWGSINARQGQGSPAVFSDDGMTSRVGSRMRSETTEDEPTVSWYAQRDKETDW